MTLIEQPKILVVDDEPEIRDLLARILGRKYLVLTAIDGEDALRMTKKVDFDLLVVDLNMPRMNGQELVKAIRDSGNSKVVFIVLTGHGTLDDAYQLLSDVNISDFLNKPVRRQDLLFSVERALREAALMKEIYDNNINLEAQVNIRTQQLKERNSELFAAKKKSEAASLAKSIFLSRMSHELRTPLNAIIGYAQLQTFLDDLPQEFLNNNQEILLAGGQLLILVEDILDFTVGVEELSLNLETVPLNPIILDSINSIKATADLGKISIHYQPFTTNVKVDPYRFKHVMDNVLSNAVKFNHSPGAVYIEVAEYDQQIEITVRDTGVGILSEDEKIIFEAFTRSAYADKQAIPGTGIGLAFCRSLMKKMNGTIGFNPQSDGASFYLRLPPEKQN